MLTSLLSAKTIPLLRRQARRYSCSSSTSRTPVSVSSAWRICSVVALASVMSRGPASLRQQVRSSAPTVLPDTG